MPCTAASPDADARRDSCVLQPAKRTTWMAVSALMAMSGFAALGYQIVWTQQLGVWLGHEIVAVLAVVTAFFGGLAAGAHVLGTRLVGSSHPRRWYAALEAVIGLWALLLSVLMPFAGEWLVAAMGATPSTLWHWIVAFAGPFLLLLPATAAMGATLPAIERVLRRARRDGYAIGGLYAANTFGAVVGVLAATFVLAPRIGFTATVWLCAAANLLCAWLSLRVLPEANLQDRVTSEGSASTRRSRRLLAVLAFTGFLGIGYEVAVVRVLSQVAENTVYTFALLLAVYLLGTAAGGAAYQRWLAHRAGDSRVGALLLTAVTLACSSGVAALWGSEGMRAAVLVYFDAGFSAALLVEVLLATSAFALPTLAMGALFSHLCVEAREAGWPLGSGLAANTLGAALAAPAIGVWLLPEFGAKVVLLSLALGYLLLLLPSGQSRAVLAPSGALAAGVLALMAWAPPLTFVTAPADATILSHREGVMAAVSVVEDGQGVRTLHINNREQEGSSAARFADARQAWLPLTLHPAPRSVLFLGLGAGVTAAAAASDVDLDVDAVELLPEVIEAAAYFVPSRASRGTPNVMAADARRYVRSSTRSYDVVVADLFHPARSGSGSLYTVEHFRAVRERLAADGLFCQWLPLHQLDIATLRSIVRSFLAVYPDAVAVLATNSLDTPVVGLVARRERGSLVRSSRAYHEQSRGRLQVREELQLDDELAVLGSIMAGPAALSAFAAGAPLNTDDRPVVAHRAPRIVSATQASPRERLLWLLRELHADPAEVLGPAHDDASLQWQHRLAAYWAARTRYIEAGMQVRPGDEVRALLAQVQQPLLQVLRLSADFRPAYDPLFNMAVALVRVDRAAAIELLRRLQDVQPARIEAAQFLQQLTTSDGEPAIPRSVGR